MKEQNKRYEKKLSELITYPIFHTKNTKAQEEICFIVRREAEKVFSYPSELTTDAHLPILPISTTHTPRRGAVVKGVEHIPTFVFVNI